MADRPDKANNRDFSSQVNHIINELMVCQGRFEIPKGPKTPENHLRAETKQTPPR
jgi:hypothetical protein